MISKFLKNPWITNGDLDQFCSDFSCVFYGIFKVDFPFFGNSKCCCWTVGWYPSMRYPKSREMFITLCHTIVHTAWEWDPAAPAKVTCHSRAKLLTQHPYPVFWLLQTRYKKTLSVKNVPNYILSKSLKIEIFNFPPRLRYTPYTCNISTMKPNKKFLSSNIVLNIW